MVLRDFDRKYHPFVEMSVSSRTFYTALLGVVSYFGYPQAVSFLASHLDELVAYVHENAGEVVNADQWVAILTANPDMKVFIPMILVAVMTVPSIFWEISSSPSTSEARFLDETDDDGIDYLGPEFTNPRLYNDAGESLTKEEQEEWIKRLTDPQ